MDAVRLEDLSGTIARVMLHELSVAGVLRHGGVDSPLDPWPQVLAAARNAVLACKGELDAWRDRCVAEALSSAPRCLVREGEVLG